MNYSQKKYLDIDMKNKKNGNKANECEILSCISLAQIAENIIKNKQSKL